MSLPIYIIGHKHPDTDSICSALALAELKQKLGYNAVAGRLGHLNPETQFILDKLKVDPPHYLTTAKSTLEEIEIDKAVTINHRETIRTAWDLCQDNHVKTLYVVDDDENYLGIATIGEISKVQMQDLLL
ncbi:MAG: DHH family phosphoesterase, partial [Erysipelotrichaceae bacterium]|nr:DHH family phosphoesterase [Erysipelotrichaceae bacterium]